MTGVTYSIIRELETGPLLASPLAVAVTAVVVAATFPPLASFLSAL